MFSRVLIAQRGEAVGRIARTLKRLGITSIAIVRTPEDELHAESCDETLALEPISDASHSISEIVSIAKQGQIDAVHPGYVTPGSFHFDLATALEPTGIPLIGMDKVTLSTLADRIRIWEVARQVGLRVPSRDEGPITNFDALAERAEQIGYPVVIKSAHRHTVVGCHAANSRDELEQAFQLCQSHAEPQGKIFTATLTQCIDRPRHIALTILADAAGEITYLPERELLPRKNHVMMEESPSPWLVHHAQGAAILEALGEGSLRVVRALGLKGVVTLEFLLDADGRSWFHSVDTGLAIGHAVTECVTSVDLVEGQLLIAAGEGLTDEILYAQSSGHAFEARVMLGDLPRTSTPRTPTTLRQVRWPPAPQGTVRLEPSVQTGSTIELEENGLLAKITTSAPVRHQAMLALDRVLAETHIAPVPTNIWLLRRMIGHESFRAGQYDAGFLDRLASGMQTEDSREHAA